MASSATIKKLHHIEATNLSPMGLIPKNEAPEPAARNLTPVGVIPERAVRGKFRVGRDERERIAFDPAELMGAMPPANAVDRSAAFMALAERERLARMAELFRSRMRHASPRGAEYPWPAIRA